MNPEKPEPAPTRLSELRDDEAAVRATLHAEAARISPHHRLDAILAASHADDVRPRARRSWLMPVAAAAAAASVVGGVLLVNHRPPASSTLIGGPTATATSSPGPSAETSTSGPTPPTQTAAPPVTTTPPATSSAPSGSSAPSSTPASVPGAPPVNAPTTSASPAASPAPATTTAALPVYYVGARPGGGQSLYREFVSARVATPASSQSRVEAALALAMGTPPAASGYLAPWAGVTVSSVALRSGEIRVGLTRGLTGVGAAQAGVAVQQLVWTAQAAAGQGALPVRFTLGNGAVDLAPGEPASGPYTRPTDPARVFTLLSPLWVDHPSRGETVPAAAVTTVTGVASTNEGGVSWQLLRGGAEAAAGVATAAQAAPARASFTIDLGRLRADDYVIRVFAVSAKDGSVSAEQRMPFTVG